MKELLKYELKLTNRFEVEFPKNFDMESWSIQSIETPKYIDGIWSDITIKFIDVIGESSSLKIYDNLINKKINNFIIKLHYLDPTGVVISSSEISIEKVLLIDFNDLSYDKIVVIQPIVKLKVNDFKIKY